MAGEQHPEIQNGIVMSTIWKASLRMDLFNNTLLFVVRKPDYRNRYRRVIQSTGVFADLPQCHAASLHLYLLCLNHNVPRVPEFS